MKNNRPFLFLDLYANTYPIPNKRRKKGLGNEFDRRNWNTFQSELETCLHTRRKARRELNELQKVEG